MKRPLALTLACAAALLTAGCPSSDPGFVQREWTTTMRELGIVPTFPPREDVVVGDVYAYDFNPGLLENIAIFESKWSDLNDDEKARRLKMGMSPRLMRLDFETALAGEYAKTISAPATSAEYNAILSNPVLAMADEKLKAQQAKAEQLKKALEEKDKAAQDATVAATKAEQAQADATTARTDAAAALTQVEATAVDTANETKKLEDAVEVQHGAQLTLLEAKAADTRASTAETKAKLADAQLASDRADLLVKQAQEDLAAAKACKVDPTAARAALADAKSKEDAATAAALTAVRARDALKAELATAKPVIEAQIKEATDVAEKLKATRDAIAATGAKNLYAQPRDGFRNVYTGAPLPTQGAPDDLANSRVNRLRLVGFPEFSSTSYTSGDLAALVPIEAMQLGINVSATNVKKVSVKVPAAESYSISLATAFKQLFTENTAEATKNAHPIIFTAKGKELSDAARLQFMGTFKSSDTGKRLYVRIITEVYYARALDISLFASDTFGTKGTLSPVVAPPPSTQPVPVVTFPSDTSAIGSTGAEGAVAAMQARLGATQSVPGGSVQLVSYSDTAVGVRRVFDRPVAIGVRGIIVEVDGAGNIYGVSPDVFGPTVVPLNDK
jgi:hypothetical protein